MQNRSFLKRLQHAWNIFNTNDDVYDYKDVGGMISTYNPSRSRSRIVSERSMVNAVYNRMAIDVASCNIRHVRVDSEDKYLSDISSSLNNCLVFEANKDQTGRAFIQDVAMSLFDEGVVAIVPTEADFSPIKSTTYEIYSLRTGKITSWYPDYVRVELYNDIKGTKETKTLPKNMVCIIENPLYSVMNEPNSTVQRLISKLLLLDNMDEQNSNGKLDLIIQLPYVIKSEARQVQAENRRKALEEQLMGSKYGIAYTDGTERITQLNRPVENNLLSQITYLTNMLYNQLGMTEDVFNGKADDKAMLNYYNRTIEPIVKAITDEINRKFLTKTARTQGQRIRGFYDMFSLMSPSEIAEIGETFTRNEILSSNDIRGILGIRPSNAPQADELRNKNMPLPTDNSALQQPISDSTDYDKILEDTLAGIESDINNILGASNV